MHDSRSLNYYTYVLWFIFCALLIVRKTFMSLDNSWYDVHNTGHCFIGWIWAGWSDLSVTLARLKSHCSGVGLPVPTVSCAKLSTAIPAGFVVLTRLSTLNAKGIVGVISGLILNDESFETGRPRSTASCSRSGQHWKQLHIWSVRHQDIERRNEGVERI